ncbi:MAG: hypothetical protein FK734_16440 [Asgard group archaeon]|nr:hypothetical protein [Asgard group archaeon]
MNEFNGEELPFYQDYSENLQLVAMKFLNGYFIAISDKNDLKLGTTAVSLPMTKGLGIKHSLQDEHPIRDRGVTSATVIGSRNELFAKALVEKAVINTGLIVYLSVNFQENNQELYIESLKLLEKFLKEL